MTNHEGRDRRDSVHVLLAFKRNKYANERKCVRMVVKNYEDDLAALRLRLTKLGGNWRIHRTVNERDTEKARLWLIHKLIDFPEGRGFVDSLWKTALLQTNHVYGKKKFMLDMDTKDPLLVSQLRLSCAILEQKETPNGWHFVIPAQDTRDLKRQFKDLTIVRDGYIFVEEIFTDEKREEENIKQSIIYSVEG
jgi:hypothetical protein